MTKFFKLERKGLLFWGAFILIVLIGAYLRFYDLSLRPLHNDEGVNFHFTKEVRARGFYPYSHENYHGPSYFYMLAYAQAAFGESETALRCVTALFGALMPFLFLMIRKKEGDSFVLIGSLFTALSPALVFYSRYAIHEILFLTFSTILGFTIYRWLDDYKPGRFYAAAVALALLVATKETFIITLTSLACAMFVSASPKKIFAGFYSGRSEIFYSFLLFIVLLFGIMSGGFQNFTTLREMFLAVPQWIGRNTSDVGHHKRAAYYLHDIVWLTEPYLFIPLVLLPVSAIVLSLVRGWSWIDERTRGIRFFAIWAISSTAIYAVVKYKTPWLEINFTFPLILCLAWLFSRIPGRFLRTAVVVVVALPAAATCVQFNLRTIGFGGEEFTLSKSIPYGPGNPFSYVQTADGMLELVKDIEFYWQKHPEARVLVGAEQYWPLPYYFRDHSENVAYVKTNEPAAYAAQYDIIITSQTVHWEQPGWISKYYRLSDVQESNTYFKAN